MSNNTALEYLYCPDNQLTSLDVSSNTALQYFSCSTNQLTSLDVSNNTALIHLFCQANQLTALDVSSNTALEYFRCNDNQLIYLNMKNGVTYQLTEFNATDNSFDCIEVNAEDVDYATENWTYANGNIDEGVEFSVVCAPEGYTYVPNNNFEQALIDLGYEDLVNDYVLTENISGVTNLVIEENGISDLTGIEDFTALTYLNCRYNQLTSLDVSANTALAYLNCFNNQLTYLNMRNGVTDALTTFDATNNDSLECIETLNPDYAPENWTYENGNIDEGVTFSVDCLFPPVVSIPDTSMNEDSEFFYDLSAYISDVDSENLVVNVDHVSQPMSEHVQVQMIGPDTLRLFARHH